MSAKHAVEDREDDGQAAYGPSVHRVKAGLDRITPRSICLGLVLSVLHTVWLVYEEAALGHVGMTSAFNPVRTVVGLIFVLMVTNGALQRRVPGRMLTATELMVVFCMTTLSAIISGGLFLHFLFPMVLWPTYMSANTRDYDSFIQYLPSHFGPRDPELITEFFNGSHHFWRFFEPDVLRAWSVPMIFWGVFLSLLVWTMLCMGSVLRRQWVDKERVPFPIVDMPLMMARERTAGSMLSNRLLLIGFCTTAAVLSMNYLSSLVPSVPSIPLAETDIGKRVFVNPPYTGVAPVVISWWPYAIGLCYLIPLDILFSCWFFYVFIRAATLAVTMLGWREAWPGFHPNQFPFFGSISQGAWVGLFISVIWGARSHLRDVWKTAVSNAPVPGDEHEPISYRQACRGGAAGFILLVAMASASGMRPQVAFLFFAIYFLVIMVMTKVYAQLAVPIFSTSTFYSSTTFLTALTGTGVLTRTDTSVLTSFQWFNFGYSQHPMGHGLESIVMAERLGESRRRMMRVVILAFAIGIVVGMLALMQIMYDRGAASALVNGGPRWLADVTWRGMVSSASNPQSVQLSSIAKISVSTVIVVLLAWARDVWFGFPLHPVGYVLACNGALEWIWNIMLVVWAVKALVVRYGGLHLYRRSLPLFYGIILGDALTQFVWGIGMALLGIRGASAYGPASM